jgi:hypothetical protein
MKFPTEKVAEITKTDAPQHGVRGDTYRGWSGGTLTDLKNLVDIGACNLEDAQNASPTIGEFLKELKKYGDKITLIGYIIYPPRKDARVSVEGFEGNGLTASEALDLFELYGDANEQKKKEVGKTYYVRFWWD